MKPGYAVRAVRPGEDAPAVSALLNLLADRDGTEEHWSLGDVEQELRSSLIDPAQDWLVVEAGGELVATSFLIPRAPVDGEHPVGLEGGVHPDHRRRGLGTDLLAEMLVRARDHVAARSDSRPVVRTQGLTDDVVHARVLERLGFEVDHWTYVMEADLTTGVADEPVLPDGWTLATWEGADPEELRLAHNRAFREHRGWSPWSEQMWQEYVVQSRAHRPAASLLLRDSGGAIAAYLHAAEYDALEEATGVRELSVAKVGTSPDHRRQGLATTLLRTALARAAAEGYQRAGLEVDAHNETGALGVYEAVGFTVARRWTTYVATL